jgi:two-component system, NarL family, nitrate/nitrite response regulator NarL
MRPSVKPSQGEQALRLLIVDDDIIVADVLAAVIQTNWYANVDIVGDEEAARAAIEGSGPFDLVLVDFQLPGGSGTTFISELVTLNMPSPVVLISGKVGPEIVHAAIAVGARGYISKRIAVPQMLRRLQVVLSGETYVPPDVLVPAVAKKTSSQGIELTERERQVLNGVRKGKSNKEIARELELSDITVKLHVRSLLKKFLLKNRTQLAMMEVAMEFLP